MIHPTAIINPSAVLGSGVEIGPNCIIEDNVIIGKNVKLWQNVYIGPNTTIGDNNVIHMGAVLGHVPQDISFKNTMSFLKIGNNNIIREYANIHRATKENGATSIGNNNFIMGFAHIAHDCSVGNNTTIANGTVIAGHVIIEDRAVISGNCAIHQFTRIGKLAMIAGLSRVNKDIPPYMLCKGDSYIWSLNIVGLKRAGMPKENIRALKDAFNILYTSGLNTSNAVLKLEELNKVKEVREIIDFIKSSKRGISSYITHREAEEDI